MKRIVAGLLVLILLEGCASTAKQDLLDAQGFRDAYRARLEKRTDSFQVSPRGELDMTLTSLDGADFSVFLGNAFAEYQRDPSRLDLLLDNHIDSIAYVVEHETDKPVSLAQVVAVVKDKNYVAEVDNKRQPKGAVEAGKQLYFEPINAELVVVYVQDSERSVRFLNRDAVAALNIEPQELRKHALSNLTARLPGVQTRENKGLYLLEADGFYDASLLLLDEVWQSPALKIEGEIVVAIPARDVLMVTGSESRNLDFMRATAAKVVLQSGYSISPELFVRRDGKWKILAPKK